jgi:hypothetical protein
MRLTASLGWFWYFRGHYSEGRALRVAVLALPMRPDLAALRSEVLQGGGMLALLQGDYGAARAFLEEGVSLARGVGDRSLLASTLSWLGFVTRVACDYGAARPTLVEALSRAPARRVMPSTRRWRSTTSACSPWKPIATRKHAGLSTRRAGSAPGDGR